MTTYTLRHFNPSKWPPTLYEGPSANRARSWIFDSNCEFVILTITDNDGTTQTLTGPDLLAWARGAGEEES